ncbi:AN1-type zinc finger protein 4-like [Saccostrea cucullata]|uniref:AN1-type zinc finger protein 4-like n=1 Tax=Saccostrea cuccullata TaxID=36930 RepID=UPI002ED36E49
MELYIETLTGTFFELRVSPFETIMSVKAKIQRLEGIPIGQQHLIWQAMELEDDYCLHDYSIHDGATLKLVLAMRGGPINTRRIPMEDPTLREMAEYVEANRDEIWEKIPGNRQVTLLVFREGDQLNFFRVVDRGDGTLTPLSESLSGASMYNFDDQEEEEEAPPKEKLEENEQLKEKMKQLRGKMEKLTLTKKPKKKIPRPPSSEHSSSSRGARRRQLPGSGRTLSHNLNRNFCLPPVGHHSSYSQGEQTATIEISNKDDMNSGGVMGQNMAASLNHNIGSGLLNYNELETNSEHNKSHSAKSTRSRSRQMMAENTELSASRLGILSSVKEDSSLVHESQLATEWREGGVKSWEGEDSENIKSDFISSNTCTPSSSKVRDLHRLSSLQETVTKKKDVNLENYKDTLQPPPSSSSKTKQKLKGDLTIENIKEVLGRPQASNKDLTLESLQESLGRPTTSSRFKGLERRKEFTLESLSTSEARAMSGLLRQASLEKIGSSRIGNFVPSGSKSRLGNYALGSTSQEGRIISPEERLLSAHLQRVNSRDGRMLSPSHRLPPVKSKKKAAKRCFVCGKKTGLATSYICRCGNNFCATHRYAESHDCTFDYKTEGRKLLEQSNPVVSAPKLPKI